MRQSGRRSISSFLVAARIGGAISDAELGQVRSLCVSGPSSPSSSTTRPYRSPTTAPKPQCELSPSTARTSFSSATRTLATTSRGSTHSSPPAKPTASTPSNTCATCCSASAVTLPIGRSHRRTAPRSLETPQNQPSYARASAAGPRPEAYFGTLTCSTGIMWTVSLKGRFTSARALSLRYQDPFFPSYRRPFRRMTTTRIVTATTATTRKNSTIAIAAAPLSAPEPSPTQMLPDAISVAGASELPLISRGERPPSGLTVQLPGCFPRSEQAVRLSLTSSALLKLAVPRSCWIAAGYFPPARGGQTDPVGSKAS
jgi:hypothetical protein